MADPSHLGQYKYAAMSNLVLQHDRRFSTRRTDEMTGDPESLAGHINIRDMGSRTMREDAPKQKKTTAGLGDVERGSIKEGEAVLEREQKKRKRGEPTQSRGVGILSALDVLLEGLKYQPRTAATRQTYDLILTTTANSLGDVPYEVVRSAADAVLEYLKDEDMKDVDKKKEIDDILGTSMPSKQFNELVNLGKKITDYHGQDEDANKDGKDVHDTEDAELDERQGVAVVFDESDDEDDAIQRTAEVEDDTDSSSEGDSAEDHLGVGEPTVGESNHEQQPSNETTRDEGEEIIVDTDEVRLGAERQTKPHKELIPAREIDAFWLQRQVGTVYLDPHIQQVKTKEALQILSGLTENGEERSLREIENDLMDLFDYEHHELVEKLFVNRDKVVWITRWRRAEEKSEDQTAVEQEMIAKGHRSILAELHGQVEAETDDASKPGRKIKLDLMDIDLPHRDTTTWKGQSSAPVEDIQPKRLLNLENLVFHSGNHLMTNPNVKLPPLSSKRLYPGYEEFLVPAPTPRKNAGERSNMPLAEIPDWARKAFGEKTKELNRIQTKCFPAAFNDDGNMLICAPTGSGKTNVAMLAMLREIGKHRNADTGEIMLDNLKIIYIAPLKALVREQAGNFGERLKPFGIKVAELTGDRQLTQRQITDTQIIITTPEKWDVITRKANDLSYTRLVHLIIIDEIHLLHDERGPVLEGIISRTIRKTEQTGVPVRLVGLSATLPNYRDVANFLRVDLTHGLFHFDGSYRPCPLRQEFIGVTDKKAIKQLKTMNDLCYQKVIEQVGKNKQQMLIFVHSRKETAKTAKYIRDKALELETIGQILRTDAASREILTQEAESVTNKDLKDLMPYGIGIHHAGMMLADRSSVEDLFADGMLQILVCTATLAWGVNLPAHTVLIKGTQVYSPEKGSWVELSAQDTLQMLGRAGRPQYDTYGEGIIITTQAEVMYYLSLMNQQLPIESQLVGSLADLLNAEIVIGNVRNRVEAADWLGYTYLFVRMIRSPGLYSVGPEYGKDEALIQKRVDLVHSAATLLEKSSLIKYDKKTGKIQATDLGRIASHYYINHSSMSTYNRHLQPGMNSIEFFRLFALSDEFKYIPVRQDEKAELAKFLQLVPVPIKESVDDPHAKMNVLLQIWISRLKLDGMALVSDMSYVSQSANRILRAMFEICLKKGWSMVAKVALDICRMTEKSLWAAQTPLRQFPTIPREVIMKAERMDIPWPSYFDLDPARMTELLGIPRVGASVRALVKKFPRLDVQAKVLPVTRSMLRIELTITPNFEWDDSMHGESEAWWILVDDCDGEELLYHDQFLLRKMYAQSENKEHLVEFTVPLTEPKPPNYFITVMSDRWLQAGTKIAILFEDLILPEKFPPHTPLLDLQSLPASALKRQDFQDLYDQVGEFNKVQTQVFSSLFTTNDNVFVGAPTGSGKTICAEFAILRHWSSQNQGRAIYIAPFQELVDLRFTDWQKRLSKVAGGKQIVKLVGEIIADLKILEKGDLVLATPSQWDLLSRQWQRRKNVQTVQLFIADELHLVGGQGGSVYEIIVSRMHYIALQTQNNMRIVGLSVSLSNARDVGEWIGATKHTTYNFSPRARPVPLELHIQSFTNVHFPSLMLSMVRPAYSAVLEMSPDKPALIFVPSRKLTRSTALELLASCVADDDPDRFLHTTVEEMSQLLAHIQEAALADSISHGIGYYHGALSNGDKRIVSHLYSIGALQVMIASRDVCWEINLSAHLVIVMGSQFYEGREHRYIDYPISEVLQMFGRASRPQIDRLGKGVLMVPGVKREYYKKFLNEALPIESHLHIYMHDAFVAEISTRVISSTQDAVDWSTYTYFYRRLLANPSYYGLTDTSHQGLSSHLSELVENTLKDLTEAKVIDLDEEDDTVGPLSGAMIAAYYDISFITIQTFLLSLTGRTKLKGILEIVTSATEFESIPIRRHEDKVLRRIYDRVPVKIATPDYESPHFKAFILLQAHFSRMELPPDLAKDQDIILSKVLSLLSGCVDVLSSHGHLNATSAMEMSQMVVQAMWDRDSPLKQIPHFSDEVVKVAHEAGAKDIFEFMEAMDPEENKNYHTLVQKMGLDNKQLSQAAAFVNDKYPNIELEFEVEDPEGVTAGAPSYLKIKIERDIEGDGDPNTTVHAPFFPQKKVEAWWLVVGEESSKNLIAIKRITLLRSLEVRLEFVVPTAGKHDLKLYLMSDCYLGVDQDPSFTVDAAEGMSEDESEEGGGENEE